MLPRPIGVNGWLCRAHKIRCCGGVCAATSGIDSPLFALAPKHLS